MGGLTSLFGGAPKAPAPAPVVRMPDPNDPAAEEARKQQQRRLVEGSGRNSTNLTGTGKASGGDYTNTVLGA